MPHARRPSAWTLALGGLLAVATGWPQAAAGWPQAAAGSWDPGAPVETGARSPLREQAQAARKARRHAEAAAGFEALWLAQGQTADLERAAEARAAAGHLAHAIAHWDVLLAQEPGPSRRRDRVVRRMIPALRRTTPVAVTVAADRGVVPGTQVTLTWVAAHDPRPAIVVTFDKAGRSTLALDPGVWSLVASAPGHVEVQRVWTVTPGSPDVVNVLLSPVPEPAPEPVAVAVVKPAPPRVVVRPPPAVEPRLGPGLGLGLGGAVTLGVGAGLLIQHRRGYAHFDAAPNNAGFVAALSASTAGATLVGVGSGLAAAAMTVGLAPARRLESLLWVEVAAGGGVALVGAAWYSREWQRVQKDLYDGGRGDTHDAGAQRRETAAATVLGAGTGLMLGAGVALLTRTLIRLHGRRGAGRTGLAGGPGPLGAPGFQIQGRF